MKITNIKKQAFKSRLFEVHLDGEYAFSLYDNQLKDFNLEIGSSLASSEIFKIDEVVKKNALLSAMNMVLRADSTAFLISQKLKMKKYTNDVVDYVVEYMESHGYLNDSDYGRNFAKSAFQKGKGRKYVEFELSKRGISKDVIENLCDEFYDGSLIREVANKKLSSILRSKENIVYKELASLRDYLLRQGYMYDEINEVIEELKGNYED